MTGVRDGEPVQDFDPRLIRHPAKFTEEIVDVLTRMVRTEQRRLGRPILVLDPFAGVGRVHRLRCVRGDDVIVETVGVEIQASWASMHRQTIEGDSIELMRKWRDGRERVRMNERERFAIDDLVIFDGFDIVATSPCYGNRLADKHNARDGSERRSYAHDLRAIGDELDERNAGGLAWGDAYWRFHAEAYRLIRGVLRPPRGDDPGGLFLLNVSDFVRAKATVPAVSWHRGAAYGAGFHEDRPARLIDTPRLRYGENADARAEHEVIMSLRPVGAP